MYRSECTPSVASEDVASEGVANAIERGAFRASVFAVRDPLERALSAYAETDAVTRRLDGANEHQHAVSADVRYVDVPASVDNGAARFIAYLDDIAANRVPLAWRPQHSRPVADYLREQPGRLKFVGKLESLERDWPSLQKHANLKSFQKTALPPWIPAAVKPAYDQAKAVPRSDEVLQKVSFKLGK